MNPDFAKPDFAKLQEQFNEVRRTVNERNETIRQLRQGIDSTLANARRLYLHYRELKTDEGRVGLALATIIASLEHVQTKS